MGEGKEGRVVCVFLGFFSFFPCVQRCIFWEIKHIECRNSGSRNKPLQGEGDGEQWSNLFAPLGKVWGEEDFICYIISGGGYQ